MKVFIYDNGADLSNYVNAVKISNNTPVITTDVNLQYDCDALLLTGGGDVSPFLYDSPSNFLYDVNGSVDLAELFLIDKFSKSNKTIVGVCKGLQILNVYFKGSLKNVDYHLIKGKDVYHKISKTANHKINCVLGDNPIVNSRHKQAIDVLGENLKPVYVAADGTIECVISEKFPIIAVQFHPERMASDFTENFFKFCFNDFI